jgi:hypothetical protein
VEGAEQYTLKGYTSGAKGRSNTVGEISPRKTAHLSASRLAQRRRLNLRLRVGAGARSLQKVSLVLTILTMRFNAGK